MSTGSKMLFILDFRDIPVDFKYIAEPSMHSMPAVTLSPNGESITELVSSERPRHRLLEPQEQAPSLGSPSVPIPVEGNLFRMRSNYWFSYVNRFAHSLVLKKTEELVVYS